MTQITSSPARKASIFEEGLIFAAHRVEDNVGVEHIAACQHADGLSAFDAVCRPLALLMIAIIALETVHAETHLSKGRSERRTGRITTLAPASARSFNARQCKTMRILCPFSTPSFRQSIVFEGKSQLEVARTRRMFAANCVLNFMTHTRIVSYKTTTTRSARKSSTSRKLRAKRW